MTVVAGALPPDARGVVRDASRERGATLVETRRRLAHATWRCSDGRARVTIETPTATYGPLPLALARRASGGNALVAVRLLEAARRTACESIARRIEQGLETAEWPARLELLTLDERQAGPARRRTQRRRRARAGRLPAAWHPERPTARHRRHARQGRRRDPAARCCRRLAVIATAAPTPRACRPTISRRHLRAAGQRDVIAEPDAERESITRCTMSHRLRRRVDLPRRRGAGRPQAACYPPVITCFVRFLTLVLSCVGACGSHDGGRAAA